MSEIIERIDADACVPLQLLADGIISRRKCKEVIIQIAHGICIDDIPLPDLTTPTALTEDEAASDVITRLRAELASVTAERDALRERLGKMCGETLREGIDLYVELGGKYGADHPTVMELREVLCRVNEALAPQPPAPVAPEAGGKCIVCHGSGYYNTTSGDCMHCDGTGRAKC